MKPCILEKDDILKCLNPFEIIEAVEKSFIAYSSGKAVMPPPQDIVLMKGETHVKSACLEDQNLYCIKVASGFYENPKLGLSSSQGMMLLFDARTGVPQCILLDDGLLTDYRTAAAGAVAAKHLAKKNSRRVLVLGTGIQARLQVEFLWKLFPIEQLFVWGRTEANIKKYCEDVKFPFNVQPVQSVDDPKEIDIIITATPARQPILPRVDPGVHINAIGSDIPGKQEIDSTILPNAKIITDSTSQCAKNGELQHALKNGSMTEDKVYAELGEIIAQKKAARLKWNEITLFDSTGLGVQDLAIAQYVYKKLS